MKNLTELSLKNRDLVWYTIAVALLFGIFSYISLGRMEDPNFVIRQMVVTAAWPGATATQMEEQVTDKLERKFQDVSGVDYIKSYTRAGSSVVYITLKDGVKAETVRPTWQEVRNYGEDLKKELPEGVYGPYYNDHFDDVYGNIYALTGDGYDYEELRQEAEKMRRIMVNLPDVQKVSLLGVQPEKVYIECDIARLSELGISPQVIAAALNSQNQMTPTGMVDTETDNVNMRLTGQFEDVEAIKNLSINAGGRIFRLGDIARVERRFVSPSEPKMYFNGKPAVGISLSMRPGGNIIDLGNNLNEFLDAARGDLPLGMEIGIVSDQPKVVAESIGEFVGSLREAVIIVLVVTLMSLGIRTGMVVAFCIPLVLAAAFCFMFMLGIDLHKISLGALIISLGLLVDDEMIAVEMMLVKLEEGLDRFEAACYAFRETAMPMLTGTLITCAGFIPVAFSSGNASEFCAALFPVIAITLLSSWVVSVMVTPLFGYHLIKVEVNKEVKDPRQGKFYVYFKTVLVYFLKHKITVLAATTGLFVLTVFAYPHIRQEFFPTSLRPEIIVEMTLPEGSSKKNTEEEALRLAKFLDGKDDLIDRYSLHVGEGAPRFVLTAEPKFPADNYAQFIVVAEDLNDREQLTKELRAKLDDDFPNVRANVKYVPLGPPSAYPIMLRVQGYDKSKVREIAQEVAQIVASDSNNYGVNFDWSEKSKILKLKLDQDKLRAMGVSSQEIAGTLTGELSGLTAAEYYKGDRTIGIQFRLREEERQSLEKLKGLPIYLGSAGYVPLSQVAEISYEAENGLIWRRDLQPTVTVQANIIEGTANDAAKKAYEATKEIRDRLPFGYSISIDGALEMSAKSSKYLAQPIPVMLFIIVTLLMIQLRNWRNVILTLLTLPLGLIGVTVGMLLFDSAMGFVAILGVLALSGMIIRNSIILLDQIRLHLEAGDSQWDAVIDSAVLRFRPIMLTAGSSILGMVPLITSTFWGPMAVAIASGLLIATALTLLVLPVMYAVVYKVKPEE